MRFHTFVLAEYRILSAIALGELLAALPAKEAAGPTGAPCCSHRAVVASGLPVCCARRLGLAQAEQRQAS